MSQRSGMLVGPNEHPIQNEMLAIGQVAPDFSLTANNFEKHTLSNYVDKVKIISCVPSLDTKVCSMQTRKFNEYAATLGENIVILTVSADLPYAQRRWCGQEGIERVVTLSTHQDMKFADDYGVHDTLWRITQRAVFVLDKHNVVQHAEYVHKMGDEPNYDAALAVAKRVVGE